MKHTFTMKHNAINEANSSTFRGNKFALARERKNARARVKMNYLVSKPPDIGHLLRVKLIRVGPRTLDDDGLRSSLKSVRDGIAATFRMDDASPLISFDYDQERGEYAVRVELEWGS